MHIYIKTGAWQLSTCRLDHDHYWSSTTLDHDSYQTLKVKFLSEPYTQLVFFFWRVRVWGFLLGLFRIR